ncbi:hypothetical protein ACFX10_011906 [Malus domestica]
MIIIQLYKYGVLSVKLAGLTQCLRFIIRPSCLNRLSYAIGSGQIWSDHVKSSCDVRLRVRLAEFKDQENREMTNQIVSILSLCNPKFIVNRNPPPLIVCDGTITERASDMHTAVAA